MNIELLGKYYLGNGGIGDALLTLSTFYDNVESANFIFLANEPETLIRFLSVFPKLNKKLVLKNDINLLKEFYTNSNCIGTGILPKDLNYHNWYKVDIFKEYGVKQFPKFVDLFSSPKEIGVEYITVQYGGSNVEGTGKQRILLPKAIEEIKKYEDGGYEIIDISKYDLIESLKLIKNADKHIGVDSFGKAFSSMCGVESIVYDNVYSKDYLKVFKDNIDYGHYIFIFPWSTIEFRSQNEF